MAVETATLRNEMRKNMHKINLEIIRMNEEAPINSMWDGRDIVIAAISYSCITGRFSPTETYNMFTSISCANTHTTISLANGNITEIGANLGLTDLGRCYGITGVMTSEQAEAISKFVKARNQWSLDDWRSTISKDGWEDRLANVILN